MKKALIITYFKSTNYGAFLQAYSTQQFLKKTGVDARIYDYNSVSSKIVGGVVCAFSRKKAESEGKNAYRKKMGEEIIASQRLLQLDDGRSRYDLAILGSDEIWNVKNVKAAHDPFLFTKYPNAARTVAYAACAGGTSIKHLKLFPYAIKGIRALDAVAVRDDRTEALVKTLGRQDAVRVLDPSFLYDFEDEIPEINRQKPYLFVYSYGLSAEQIDCIKATAKKHGWTIIATGSNCEWADENPVPSPFEWLAYIKNAEAVVTTTFHGCAFAIHFNKKLAVMGFKSAKVQSLLKEMKLIDRWVSSWRTLDMLMDTTVDFTTVNERILRKKKFSEQFLLSQLALSEPNAEHKHENFAPNSECYVARYKNQDIRWNSRSGGAFTAISDVVLKQNGVVYGAILNEKFETIHDRADTIEKRNKMRGSKYVQSDLHRALPLILTDLKNNQTVLFTGTPCQTDAVRRLAEINHCSEKLITMDFICHGVPSPLVWREYLAMYPNVTDVDFRDKKKFGWKAHVETITTNNKKKSSNIYTKLYYANYCVRPSCHECPYAQYERYSDVTIADGWGVEEVAPGFNTDDSGVSMIVSNTTKGSEIVQQAIKAMDFRRVPISKMQQPVLQAQGMGTCVPAMKRQEFWSDFHEKGIKYVCMHYSTDNIKSRLKNRLRVPHAVRFVLKKALRKV